MSPRKTAEKHIAFDLRDRTRPVRVREIKGILRIHHKNWGGGGWGGGGVGVGGFFFGGFGGVGGGWEDLQFLAVRKTRKELWPRPSDESLSHQTLWQTKSPESRGGLRGERIEKKTPGCHRLKTKGTWRGRAKKKNSRSAI